MDLLHQLYYQIHLVRFQLLYNANGILSITESPSSNGGSYYIDVLEVQALNTVGLTTTLTGGTSIQFINSPSVTITQGGTASNATLLLTLR